MKVILFYSLICCISIFTCEAQVGIKTSTPLGVLHIDAGTVGSTADDVIVDNQGRMGIETAAPTGKLHIKAPSPCKAISVVDGNQSNSSLMTSDSQGMGTWKFGGLTTLKGTLGTAGKTFLITDVAPRSGPGSGFYTGYLYDMPGTQITLPPGRWCVYTNFLINTSGSIATDVESSNVWIRLSYSDTPGGLYSTDIDGAPWSSGAVYTKSYGMIQGFIVIVNRTSSNKTYYMGIAYANQGVVSDGVQVNNLASSTKEENGILAVKIANN